MKNCRLELKAKYLLTLNDEDEIIEDASVFVDAEKIVAVGKSIDLQDKYKAEEVVDTGNSILMPSFVNAHTHLAMSYFRGIADDANLDDWLNKHIWPAEGKYVNEDFVRRATELSALEMIEAGISTANDMYFFADKSAEVLSDIGLRSQVSEPILNFSTPSMVDPEEAIKNTLDLAKKYKDSSLVNISLNPHSVYICSQDLLKEVGRVAKENNLPIHIHLSETKKENDDLQAELGKSPTEYLNELGLINENSILAHGVWLSDDDISIIRDRGASVVHCPISNMKLGSGVMPITKMKGINVALGTDGVASNNTLDMFSEMRVCALLHKLDNLDASAIKARDIVGMATVNGARALGIKSGVLQEGSLADIITVNLDKAHAVPMYDPYSHLVFSAQSSDVETLVVGGRVLMKGGEVLGIDGGIVIKDAVKFMKNFQF